MKILDFRLWIAMGMLALHAPAFEATLSISPPIISLGEAAQISIVVHDAKRPSAPILPQIDGLTFSGAGQSTQHRWINGKTDRSTTYTFRVYPQKTGDFTIGPFNYTIDRKTQILQGQLKVVATSGDAARPQSWNDLLFAKLTTSREKVYVQEPFDITLSIYSRSGVQMAGNINLEGMPKTGLSELKWQEGPGSREQVGGQLYDVRRFHSTTRAMGSGTFEFAPTVTVQVAVPNQSQRSDPFFGSFFNQTQTRPVQLLAEKATVSILPLPTLGKPANFSGAVGQFNFSVTAQPTQLHPGDPATVTMTIVGNGNFDRILPPALPNNDSFRLFGDAVREQGNNGVRFEQVISPRNADVEEIPPLTFSFFDTDAGRYRTITSQAIPITVTASSNLTAQVFAAQDNLLLPPPDQPFATESDVQRFLAWLHRCGKAIRPWLWTLPATLGVGLALFFVRKIHHWRRKDIASIRRQKAPKAARQALRTATQARSQSDAPAFYNALWNALAEYFGNRLDLAPGEVSAEVVLKTLQKAAIPEGLLASTQSLFEQLDTARYSPHPAKLDPKIAEQQQIDVTQLLKQLEKRS